MSVSDRSPRPVRRAPANPVGVGIGAALLTIGAVLLVGRHSSMGGLTVLVAVVVVTAVSIAATALPSRAERR